MIPEEFIERFSRIVPHEGDPRSCFLAKKFRSFRVNALKADRVGIFTQLRTQGIHFQEVPWYPDAFIVDLIHAKQLLTSPLCVQGMIYAQGLESMLAPIVLDPRPGWQVLDLCAAPGSKTTQIAALMDNQGNIMANEPVRDRFFGLRRSLSYWGRR